MEDDYEPEEDWEEPAAVGRRPLLRDPDIQQRILKSLRLGNSKEASAEAAGIGRATLFAWLRRGEDQERRKVRGPYRDFLDGVRLAQAQAIDKLVTTVGKAARFDPDHAKWMLERLDPRRWGNKVNVVITEELDLALERLQAALSPEEYERALQAICGEPGRGAADQTPDAEVSGPAGPAAPAGVDPAGQP